VATTLYDLVHRYTWDEIEPVLLREYPDQKRNVEGYRQVYDELLRLEPAANDEHVKIVIEYVTHGVTGEKFWNVSGVKPNNPQNYGLSFCRWEQWLGYYINRGTLRVLSEVEILAHCLWEMTWNGFTQERI
jgi:hypothetical protein